MTFAGTELATTPGVDDPERRAETWRGRRSFYLMQEARAMPSGIAAVGASAHAAILAILLASGLPVWRVVVVGVLFTSFMTMQRLVMRRVRDAQCIDTAFLFIACGAQVFVVGSAAVTGGVHSPFVPNLVQPAIVSLFFFGQIPASRWLAAANGSLIVAMLALPASVVGPGLADVPYAVSIVMCLGWSLFMLHHLAGKLSRAAARAGETYACLREERVSEAEAQLRRLQSVGAKVAHELKNPLAAIKGLCQLVARTPANERTPERLAVVESEIARMETILREYLSFSRPLEDLNPEAVELGALARDVCDVLAGRADEAGVQLAVEGPATRVQGDPRRLKEALINLVSNAIEATPTGGSVQLRVRSAGGSATLAVRDTGRGIAADDLPRLGTSFFTTREGGTGLGVVLAQGVITQHGGTLAYASKVGEGTTATITLPASASAVPELGTRGAMVEARA